MNKKEELKRDISAHRNAISDQVQYYKKTGRKIGLTALAAGGAFFLAYSISRGIAAGKRERFEREIGEDHSGPVYIAKPEPQKSSFGIGRKIGSIILSEVGIILIGLAKNQIKNYISKLDFPNDEEDTE